MDLAHFHILFWSQAIENAPKKIIQKFLTVKKWWMSEVDEIIDFLTLAISVMGKLKDWPITSKTDQIHITLHI